MLLHKQKDDQFNITSSDKDHAFPHWKHPELQEWFQQDIAFMRVVGRHDEETEKDDKRQEKDRCVCDRAYAQVCIAQANAS